MTIEKKVLKHGLLTIPKYYRLALNINEGDHVKVTLDKNKIIIEKK